MLFYGIELAAGTQAANLTVEGGSTNPTTSLYAGRLFFNTSTSLVYFYDGSTWKTLSGTMEAPGGEVTSFNTRTGDVVLNINDLSGILPTASATVLGAVMIGSGLTMTSGVLSALSTSSIPSGSKLVWAQPSAPTGWTQDVTVTTDNRMLRVVAVAGGTTGSGGTGGGGYSGIDSPILMDKVPSHTHTFSGTTSTNGNHTHTVPDSWGGGGNTFGGLGYNFLATQTGVAGDHSHTISGSTSGNTGAANWSPKYLNLIVCTKD